MTSFIGRDAEQGTFREALDLMLVSDETRDQDEGRLVLVSGHGGIGKSTLLRRFDLISRGEREEDERFRGQFLVVDIDWDVRESKAIVGDVAGPPSEYVVARLAEAITSAAEGRRHQRKVRSAFDDFRRQLAEVLRRRASVPSVGGRGHGAGVSERQTGEAIAGSAVEGILGMTPVAPLAKPANELVAVAYGRVADALADNRRARNILREVDDAAVSCREAFARGVRKVAKNQPIVIIADTCELLGGAADVLRVLIRECGPNVCWIVGVRLESESEAAEDSDAMRYRRAVAANRVHMLELRGFDAANVRDYLARHLAGARSDDGRITDLMRLTRGVPLAIALVATMITHGASLPDLVNEIEPSENAARMVRELAERYLRHVSNLPSLSGDLPLLQGIALLPEEVGDYGLLGALWDAPERTIQGQLRDLARRHDFVFSGRLASPQAVMHKEIRDTLRKTMRDPDQRASVRPMNKRALDYLRRQLRGCALYGIERQLSQNDQDQHVRMWQYSALALLWHAFWFDAAEGVALIRHLYPPAAVLAPSFAYAQGRIARFHLGTPGIYARRLLRLLADPPIPMTIDELEKALDELGNQPIADNPYDQDIQHEVYYRLMRITYLRSAKDAAFALRINDLRIASGLIEQLRPDTRNGKRTAAILADEAKLLGVELSQVGAYGSAIDAFDIELLWRPDNAEAHGHLALAHAALGNSDEAGDAFKNAIRVNPENPIMHAAFGQLMIVAGLGDAQGRREALDWAIRKSTKDDAQALLLRGLTTQRLTTAETHEEAVTYFTRALDAVSGGEAFQQYELRAIAHAALGATEKAIGEFESGIQYWTPADKYRRKVYELLGAYNRSGAKKLTDMWQEIITSHPDSARPWG